ncbi:MAG: ABC transporter permease [Cytophagales bacterium]|nr:ABC transporter permease [Cytophagales bacterium]
MNKILLVIQREYLTRVQKKSFWIASLLGPILITAIYAIPIWLAMQDKEVKRIEILDESGLFQAKDLVDKEVEFKLVNKPAAELKASFSKEGFVAFVHLPKNIVRDSKELKIYSEKNLSLPLKSSIERVIEKKVRATLMQKAGIASEVYEKTQVEITSETISVSSTGDETSSSSGGAMILAGVMGMLLYITLLLYGSQVMAGVIEEKSSRIIEVIISSIKPYQLMLGKILGVGMVGLTQFLLWIVLTIGLTQVASTFYGSSPIQQRVEQVKKADPEVAKTMEASPMDEVTKVIESTNIPLVLGGFLFYFLFGYLLYSSLFAAIGSAVESTAEAQQFTFIVMLPIILAFIMAQFTMQDPDSTMAFWASMIPFTSPINMMVRLPYGVPMWELATSMVLLVLGFLGCSWISARIYRVGILMYGKKITVKEMAKWLFYKG